MLRVFNGLLVNYCPFLVYFSNSVVSCLKGPLCDKACRLTQARPSEENSRYRLPLGMPAMAWTPPRKADSLEDKSLRMRPRDRHGGLLTTPQKGLRTDGETGQVMGVNWSGKFSRNKFCRTWLRRQPGTSQRGKAGSRVGIATDTQSFARRRLHSHRQRRREQQHGLIKRPTGILPARKTLPAATKAPPRPIRC
jgi:hypothetical protein